MPIPPMNFVTIKRFGRFVMLGIEEVIGLCKTIIVSFPSSKSYEVANNNYHIHGDNQPNVTTCRHNTVSQ